MSESSAQRVSIPLLHIDYPYSELVFPSVGVGLTWMDVRERGAVPFPFQADERDGTQQAEKKKVGQKHFRCSKIPCSRRGGMPCHS